MAVEQTKEAMIESNLGLVHTAAQAYRGRGVAYDDLVQEGILGLMQGVERFDPARGVKFSTYAGWWIRGALIDAVRQAPAIRLPEKAQRGLAAVKRAERELRNPAPEAIAERTGLGAGRVRSLRDAAHVAASLDAPVGADGTPLVELVADPDPADPWRRLDKRETHRRVWSLLRSFPAATVRSWSGGTAWPVAKRRRTGRSRPRWGSETSAAANSSTRHCAGCASSSRRACTPLSVTRLARHRWCRPAPGRAGCAS